MQRWITGILTSVLVAFGAVAPATAQTTLIGSGGLTALPTVTLGPDQLKNGGFETLSGGVPANWGTGSGWAADQLTKHSGTFSYRRGTGSPTVSQAVALKKGIYKLSAWVKTQSLGNGTNGMRLTLDERPTIDLWHPSDLITGTMDWTLIEVKNIVIVQDETVFIQLENYAGGAGTAWFDDVKLEEQLPQSVDVFMLYPNYRGMMFAEGPSTMKFDVSVTPPGGDFGRYKITGTVKDEASGQVVTTKDFTAAANLTAELDGATLQMSKAYLVTFSLVDLSSNAATYTYPAYRVSRVPAGVRAGMNMAYDDKNRVLMHGTPRFVLGVYDSATGYSTDPTFWENLLWSPTGERRMDGLKINMYLNYWYGSASAESMKALMDNLQKHGVMYLQTGNCFDRFAADAGFGINASDNYVQTIGAHPASAGYYTVDECITRMIPGAFTQYDRLRRLDPDSVTFMAQLGNPDLAMWRDTVDLSSTDPYPMYGAEPGGGYNHKMVADWTANNRNMVKNARPYLTVLQFFQFTSLGRWPTRQEMRNHAYMAIVEGAKGLFWWSLGDNALRNVCGDWCQARTDHMNDLKSVVGEIAGLEAALLSDDATTALTANSNPNIKTKVKIVDGTGYIFAYNATPAQASATFTWNTAPGAVAVNAENRTLAASGNSFTDSFGPYQAHVYVLGNGGTGGGTGGGGTGGGGTTAPTVSFTNPAAGTTTVTGTVTVTLAASGGSGTGYNYKLDVDGANVYTGTNPTFSWNTTTVNNASHTLTGTVTDSAGQSGSATRTLTVSNTTTTPPPPPPPPTGGLQVFVTQPTGGATVSGTNWAVLWLNGATGTSNTYTLSVGTQTVGTTTTGSVGPVTIPWNTASVGDGTKTLTANVKDASGKTGSTSVAVNVKNGTTTTPALTLAFSSPAATTVSGTVSVGLTAAGGSGTGYIYTLAIDGGAASAVANPSSWNTTTVINGSHTLTATVKDSTGRIATATRTVTVSNGTATPPPATGSLQVAVTQPTGGAIVSGTNWAITWVTGATGTRTYTLTAGGKTVGSGTASNTTGPASIPWDTRQVADGTQTLTVSVRDSAGKTGSINVSVTVRNNAAAPAPTPTPVGSLQVAITQPTGGSTVSGTAWVVMWVNGASGTSNVFTLSVDGTTVGTSTVANGGPVTLPWVTSTPGNGSHAVKATVRDATGNTGSTSVTVTVAN